MDANPPRSDHIIEVGSHHSLPVPRVARERAAAVHPAELARTAVPYGHLEIRNPMSSLRPLRRTIASTLDRNTLDPPIRASVHRHPLRIGGWGQSLEGKVASRFPPEAPASASYNSHNPSHQHYMYQAPPKPLCSVFTLHQGGDCAGTDLIRIVVRWFPAAFPKRVVQLRMRISPVVVVDRRKGDPRRIIGLTHFPTRRAPCRPFPRTRTRRTRRAPCRPLPRACPVRTHRARPCPREWLRQLDVFTLANAGNQRSDVLENLICYQSESQPIHARSLPSVLPYVDWDFLTQLPCCVTCCQSICRFRDAYKHEIEISLGCSGPATCARRGRVGPRLARKTTACPRAILVVPGRA